jgi:hypothetical protein
MSSTVKMVKQDASGGITATADVHRDEIGSFQSGGWILAEIPMAAAAGTMSATVKKAVKRNAERD